MSRLSGVLFLLFIATTVARGEGVPPVAGETDPRQQAAPPIGSIIPQIYATAGIATDPRPHFLIFPVSWSPDGKFVYVRISQEGNEPPYETAPDRNAAWIATWTLESMITDYVLVRAALPLDLDYGTEARRGTAAFSAIFTPSGTAHLAAYRQMEAFGLHAPEEMEFVLASRLGERLWQLALPRTALTLRVDSTRMGNNLTTYEIRATFEDGRAKLISNWPRTEILTARVGDTGDEAAGSGRGGGMARPTLGVPEVTDLTILGALVSPYEPRIAVLLARGRRDPRTGYQWVEHILVGCHLTARLEK